MWKGLLLLVSQAMVAHAAATSVVLINKIAGRIPPMVGFGSELVWQSVNDPQVQKALAESGAAVGRYPGGTPSDYWLWSKGWVNVSNDLSGSGKLPERTATPTEWSSFAHGSNLTATVIDLCQLSCSLEYELEGLRAHAAAGTEIRFVELGNEMYDSTRADVMAKYPEPVDYANAMLPWISAIKREWPAAQVALIGERWNDYHNPREDSWNEQVLKSPAGRVADATTLHIYCGWDSSKNMSTQENIAEHLAVAATRAWSNGDIYQNGSIPKEMRVWVTEMGTFPPGSLDNTWLHGLFYGAMDMLLPAALPSLEILTPYCALCADPTASAFSSPFGSVIPVERTGDVPVFRTLVGEAQAIIFSALRGATMMFPFVFSINPPLSPTQPRSRTLIGWSLEGTEAKAILMNQGPGVTLDVSATNTTGAGCTFPAAMQDVTRSGLTVSELKHTVMQITGGQLQVPHYSICVLTN